MEKPVCPCWSRTTRNSQMKMGSEEAPFDDLIQAELLDRKHGVMIILLGTALESIIRWNGCCLYKIAFKILLSKYSECFHNQANSY